MVLVKINNNQLDLSKHHQVVEEANMVKFDRILAGYILSLVHLIHELHISQYKDIWV